MKKANDPNKKIPLGLRLERRLVSHLREESRRQRRTMTAVLTIYIEQGMKRELGASQ